MIKKILQIRFMPVFLLFLIIATPVSANEIIRLNQFNNHLKQAQDLNASEKPQEAQEALFQAQEKITPTLLVKTLKNNEVEQAEREIEEMKQLVDEKVKKAIAENLPTPTLTPTQIPTPIQSKPLTSVPTSTSPLPTPTEIDWEQFNKELSESLKEVRSIDDDNSNGSIEPTISIGQQKATKIISISDSLGNSHETDCRWSNTHYECPPKEQKEIVVSINTTPHLTFTINARDPNNRPLTYHYYYAEGCRTEGSNWITSNTCTSTLKNNQLGLRTFIFYVKNDDNYNSVGLDANTTLLYRITE
jgi:hypothetical protein